MQTNHPKRRDSGGRRRAVRRQRWLLGLLSLGLLLCLVLRLRSCGSRKEPKPATSPAPEAQSGEALSTQPDQGLSGNWEWVELPEGALSQGELVLVNGDHSFNPALALPVSVYEGKTDSYQVKDVYLSLEPTVLAALNHWMDDYAGATGRRDVNIIAGHRSLAKQQELWQNAVDTKGEAYAKAYLAQPGHSEHHTGLALDLDTYDRESGTSGGFDGTGDQAWAAEHAWEYGFIQRYPPEKAEITGIDYEAWHYRYVGLPHAKYMAEHGLCLEEYIQLLRRCPWDGEHLRVDCGADAYEIWFCPGLRIAVPRGSQYSVSGNNVDGCVVTLRLAGENTRQD